MFGDMGKMMKQVAEMKSKMAAAEKELKELTLTGRSKDGKVEIDLNGKMQLKDVRIPENKDIEKAVKEALEEALQTASAQAADRLKDVTGGVKIPGIN